MLQQLPNKFLLRLYPRLDLRPAPPPPDSPPPPLFPPPTNSSTEPRCAAFPTRINPISRCPPGSIPRRNESSFCFFFNDTATTEIYTLSLHDALPISVVAVSLSRGPAARSIACRSRFLAEKCSAFLARTAPARRPR